MVALMVKSGKIRDEKAYREEVYHREEEGTTGIAHTYMATEGIEKAAKAAGCFVKVETTEKEKGASGGAGHKVYTQLMNGVSHMLPFVVGGGILIALAFLIDGFGVDVNSLFFSERLCGGEENVDRNKTG